MKLKALCVASIFAVSGCATCQQHPVWCAVGTAVVVGSIAATIELHNHDSRGAPRAASQCGAIGPDGRGTGVIGACVGTH